MLRSIILFFCSKLGKLQVKYEFTRELLQRKKELKIEKEEGNELRIIFNDKKIYI